MQGKARIGQAKMRKCPTEHMGKFSGLYGLDKDGISGRISKIRALHGVIKSQAPKYTNFK